MPKNLVNLFQHPAKGENQMRRLVPLLLLLVATSAHAEMHRWVDAAGNVHYSDTAPPPDAIGQKVLVPQTSATGAASAPSAGKSIFERAADLEKARKQEQADAQKAAEKQQQADAKHQNCINARNALNVLESAPRLATYDAQGNRTMVDDAERQRRMEQARESISKFCN